MPVKWPFFVIIQKFFFGGAEAWKTLILSRINIFGSGHFMAHIWKKHDFDGVDTTAKKQCFPRTKCFQICCASGQTWTFKMLFYKKFGRKMFEAINWFNKSDCQVLNFNLTWWNMNNPPLLFWFLTDGIFCHLRHETLGKQTEVLKKDVCQIISLFWQILKLLEL